LNCGGGEGSSQYSRREKKKRRKTNLEGVGSLGRASLASDRLLDGHLTSVLATSVLEELLDLLDFGRLLPAKKREKQEFTRARSIAGRAKPSWRSEDVGVARKSLVTCLGCGRDEVSRKSTGGKGTNVYAASDAGTAQPIEAFPPSTGSTGAFRPAPTGAVCAGGTAILSSRKSVHQVEEAETRGAVQAERVRELQFWKRSAVKTEWRGSE
jgi:hypothetical protein